MKTAYTPTCQDALAGMPWLVLMHFFSRLKTCPRGYGIRTGCADLRGFDSVRSSTRRGPFPRSFTLSQVSIVELTPAIPGEAVEMGCVKWLMSVMFSGQRRATVGLIICTLAGNLDPAHFFSTHQRSQITLRRVQITRKTAPEQRAGFTIDDIA